MRATRSARALMTTNDVHVLGGGRRVGRVLVADRSQGESAIAVRAIQRLLPQLEVRSVASFAEASRVLEREPVATIFVASGLDGRTHPQTIRWFADMVGDTVVIALLERCDDCRRQEALAAGASYLCSKPELLVGQLRHEADSRLARAASERPARADRYRWDR
jgi:DNA-binding NarL/FixJ family response regulator